MLAGHDHGDGLGAVGANLVEVAVVLGDLKMPVSAAPGTPDLTTVALENVEDSSPFVAREVHVRLGEFF